MSDVSILLANLTATRILSVALQSGRIRARIGVKFTVQCVPSSAAMRVNEGVGQEDSD